VRRQSGGEQRRQRDQTAASRDRVYQPAQRRDGDSRAHEAVDILAPRNTPVYAVDDGSIAKLFTSKAGGITVYQYDRARQFCYYYAHLDRYSDKLPQTVRVKQGFVIGYVGTTGNAPPNTPHLHFQAMRLASDQRDWWNGTPVDVRAFITLRGKARE